MNATEELTQVQPKLNLTESEKDTLRTEFLGLPEQKIVGPKPSIESILQKARDAKVPNPTVESLTIDNLIAPKPSTHNEAPQSGKAG